MRATVMIRRQTHQEVMFRKVGKINITVVTEARAKEIGKSLLKRVEEGKATTITVMETIIHTRHPVPMNLVQIRMMMTIEGDDDDMTKKRKESTRVKNIGKMMIV